MDRQDKGVTVKQMLYLVDHCQPVNITWKHHFDVIILV